MQPKTQPEIKMSLDNFRVINVNLSIDDSYLNTSSINVEMNVSQSHHYVEGVDEDTDQHILLVRLGLKIKEINQEWTGEVEGLAQFSFNIKPNKTILKQFANINCPAILMPYVREALADLTRRAGFPAIHAPLVNFIQLAKENNIKTKQVSEKK